MAFVKFINLNLLTAMKEGQMYSQYRERMGAEGNAIKVQQNLKSTVVLERAISGVQGQVEFMQKMIAFLETNSPEEKLKQLGKSSKMQMLATPSMRISQLERQATSWQKMKQQKAKTSNIPTESKIQQHQKGQKCDVQRHLKTLLKPKQTNHQKQSLSELEEKKKQLYSKISKSLQQDQPYMHDKILSKIQRDTKKYIKLRTISELEAFINQKSRWLEQKKKKVDKQALMKTVEQSVSANLQKMKELMNKKIQIDEYIKSVAGDQRGIQKRVERMRNMVTNISEHADRAIKNFKEIELEMNMAELQGRQNQSDNTLDQKQIKSCNQLMIEALQLVSQPLGTESSQILLEEVQAMSARIALWKKSKR